LKATYSLVLLIISISYSISAQKIDLDQILTQNLLSVGSAEKRVKLKNLTALAKVQYSFGPNHKDVFDGPAVIVAQGSKAAMAFALPFQDYPQEKFSFDGKTLRIGFARPGIRSLFGEFIYNYPFIVKEPLLFGPFRWSVYTEGSASKSESLSYEGTKKIDGREAYVISGSDRSGTGMSIRMYFDKETFHHVKTEYRRTVSAAMGSRQAVPEHISDTRQALIEEFSDFTTENDITLPRTYKVRLVIETGAATREILLVFNLRSIVFNQILDPSTFNIEEIK
jgi:hypothetical protein